MSSGLSSEQFASGLREQAGLILRIGPFTTRLKSDLESVAIGIGSLYGEYVLHEFDDSFIDFTIALESSSGIRRWYHPQVNFVFDGKRPFKPLPQDQGVAMFEWGFNWCIYHHAHHFLIIHAAVVEKHGMALILPGLPAAGKSTLCAGLVSRGWRLLSDELTLIPSHNSREVIPVPRPIGLKNQSIKVIRDFFPEAVFGPVAHDTTKGTVAHLKAPMVSVQNSQAVARPGLVVFPRYKSGSVSKLTQRSKSSGFMELARQSFNYNVLGETGFDRLVEVITQCDCYDFQYSDLEDGVRIMNELIAKVSDRNEGDRMHA